MKIKKAALLLSASLVMQATSAATMQCLDYSTAYKLSKDVAVDTVFYKTDYQEWSLMKGPLPESGSWQWAMADVSIGKKGLQANLYCYTEPQGGAPSIKGRMVSSPSFKECFINGTPLPAGTGGSVPVGSVIECK